MRKDEYLKIRKFMKSICLDNVLEICEVVGLTEYETNLMIHVNKNNTRVYSSLDLGICTSKFSKDCHKVFTKIRDYLKRNNIQY